MSLASVYEAPAGRVRLGVQTAFLALASPALVIFIATNLANAGNLAFNMIFSRLLSPAAFHDLMVILTLKLAMLSVISAAQLAVSQMIADGADKNRTRAALSRLSKLSALFSGVLVVPLGLIAISGGVSETLGLGSDILLPILLLILPVAAPLCIARGAALGQMSMRDIVLSTNLEMIVRLGGALLAWSLDLGVAGIVAAIALSVYAGWLPVRGAASSRGSDLKEPADMAGLMRGIVALAWPFAILQLAMVGHLDGDVLLAATLLPEHEAGLVAGLTLIQRIQFYAFFGLSGILLPMVTAAAREGRPTLRPALPVIALIAGSGVILTAIALLAPSVVVELVAGPAYVPAAPFLLFAVLAGISFTGTYLAATFLAALGDRSGIFVAICALPLSIAALWIGGSQGGIGAMMATKATMQGALLLVSIALVARAMRRAS